MTTIYGKGTPVPPPYAGIVDTVLEVSGDRPIRLLQLTDMQIIDSSQRRTHDRLAPSQVELWRPEAVDVLCFDQIRQLVEENRPDLIFITGDIIYGEFDDSGRFMEVFCDFMGSLGVPWAPVYGNHDNESQMGVDWQNTQFENAPNSLFCRGTVSGNGNYSLLITRDGKPSRVLYMMDSGGCGNAYEPEVRRRPGFTPDQMEWVESTAASLCIVNDGQLVPGFMAFHIPSSEFQQADSELGYTTTDGYCTLGVNVPVHKGDFGCRWEAHSCFVSPADFPETLHRVGVNGVFAGHCHSINTSVFWRDIRWTYGLKTGLYDYHTSGQVGGTLITLTEKRFEVCHAPVSFFFPTVTRK